MILRILFYFAWLLLFALTVAGIGFGGSGLILVFGPMLTDARGVGVGLIVWGLVLIIVGSALAVFAAWNVFRLGVESLGVVEQHKRGDCEI